MRNHIENLLDIINITVERYFEEQNIPHEESYNIFYSVLISFLANLFPHIGCYSEEVILETVANGLKSTFKNPVLND